MNKEINLKKGRIYFGIFCALFMLTMSTALTLKPEVFIRNVFMKELHIQIIGIVVTIYFLFLLLSLFKILQRKRAILITDDFILDRSKYESIGKIKWEDILRIERVEKRTIKVTLNKDTFKPPKRNVIKKFLAFMGNWNYKNSIIISSALLACSIEELFETITEAFEKHNLKKPIIKNPTS